MQTIEATDLRGSGYDNALCRQVLEALKVRVDRAPVAVAYRAGLLLVAIVMLLLPLIYIGIIALVAWLLFLHATTSVAIFENSSNIRAMLAIYFGPLIIGAVLLFFMVKPLFAGEPRHRGGVTLHWRAEPVLFQYVEGLCRAVGAPAPREIRVDCDVNASAGFRHGIFSLFASDLELTIGLPLAADLDLQQFTGILAHELGHFSQGAGMRLSYIIRRISLWFARVVYERDTWDETLDGWVEAAGGWMALVLLLAKLFIFVTRVVLFGLMWIGALVSAYMLRRMEYHADQCAVRVVGSETYGRTLQRIPLLCAAVEVAAVRLAPAWRQRQAVPDIPALIAGLAGKLPEDLQARLLEAVKTESTGPFSTHPSTMQRIVAAQSRKVTGAVHLDQPTALLFRDFGQLCQEVSRTVCL